MKKLFLLLFSAIALSAAVHAQDSTTALPQRKGPAIRQQRMDMMQHLDLTNEQKAKLQKLREEQKAKLDSIRNSSLSDEEKMEQQKKIRESGHKSMEELLTPEQRTKMLQMRTEQMERRKAMKQDADSTK